MKTVTPEEIHMFIGNSALYIRLKVDAVPVCAAFASDIGRILIILLLYTTITDLKCNNHDVI